MNKGIKYIALVTLAAAAAVSAYAANGNIEIKWSAADVTGIAIDSAGTPLPVGSTIEIGDFTGAANTALTGFNVFASTPLPNDYGGAFWNVITSDGSDGPTPNFVHQQLYLVALYNGNKVIVTDPAWVFPATGDIPNLLLFDIEDAVSNPGTPGAAVTGTQLAGGFSADIGGNSYFYMIPEPSSITLVVVGLLGAFGMIRRRRS